MDADNIEHHVAVDVTSAENGWSSFRELVHKVNGMARLQIIFKPHTSFTSATFFVVNEVDMERECIFGSLPIDFCSRSTPFTSSSSRIQYSRAVMEYVVEGKIVVLKTESPSQIFMIDKILVHHKDLKQIRTVHQGVKRKP
jgi:hypothetical protein